METLNELRSTRKWLTALIQIIRVNTGITSSRSPWTTADIDKLSLLNNIGRERTTGIQF